MSDYYDPALMPSRAAWKDFNRGYLDRENTTRDRLERYRQEYREQQMAACSHGRVRRTGMNGARLWGGLDCEAGKCGIVYLPFAEILAQWRDGDSQPEAKLASRGDVSGQGRGL